MGQVVQTNGDYTIRAIADTVSGGRIVLDTGPNIGEVRITGNLVVTGDVLNVEASQLNIADNTITVNSGEAGAGVTLFYAGLEVDRGSLPNAAFIYDEINGNWLLAAGSVPGPFDFANDGTSELNPRSTSRLKLKEILTDASTDTGDLLLIGDGNGVIKVRIDPLDNGTEYQSNVVNPNDVPNKKYVDDAIQNNPTFQIISNAPSGSPLTPNSASRVIITDTNTAGSTAYFSANTGYTTYGESAVSVLVDGSLIAQFFNNRLEVGGLEIGGGDSYEISTKSFVSNQNIFIRTQGTGRLETNYGLELHRIGVPSGYPTDATLLYSATPGPGKSGLYFYHDQGRDELISRRRALLFSMIF